MLVDAVVLAGGRSTRLAHGHAEPAGPPAKASLLLGGSTLLNLAVSATLSIARECVVVGPVDGRRLADAVLTTRETPHFAGPAAAIAAGMERLDAAHAASGTAPADAVLVLACDMPGIVSHLAALLEALAPASPLVDGVISVDDSGHRQPLAALYRRAALANAIGRLDSESLVGLSVRELIAPLALSPLAALDGATDDVDTWEDAARFGAHSPTTNSAEGAS